MIESIRQFLLHPKETGGIESSDELAELITDIPNLASAKSVVELGPGTGVFTERVIAKAPKRCRFFCIETNGHFSRVIAEKYPYVRVYRDSAINIRKYLAMNGLRECDVIISGLPWASFEEDFQEQLLQEIRKSLKKGGEFLKFSYVQSMLLPAAKNFRALLHENFSEVRKTDTVWKNLPPAFVYHCRK